MAAAAVAARVRRPITLLPAPRATVCGVRNAVDTASIVVGDVRLVSPPRELRRRRAAGVFDGVAIVVDVVAVVVEVEVVVETTRERK
jgi:hypothetical protein